ncbi:MAG: hypothetical protein NPIRA02_02340 [Nitrospirales bacterium]|nr:MAG: hypothetical protein NPIRA02_02340 [Nitrospirales bacterium]
MNQQHAPVSTYASFTPTQVISKLMALWYRTIVLGHHKDRDCHFTIETRFSYGGQVRYVLTHHGYLEPDIEEEYWSYELAEQALIRLLHCLIRKHCQGHITLDPSREEAYIDEGHEILEELVAIDQISNVHKTVTSRGDHSTS